MSKNHFLLSLAFCLLTLISFIPITDIDAYQLVKIRTNQFNKLELEQSQLKIINEQIILSPEFQRSLQPEITKAKRELDDLSQKLAINFTDDVGIVYFHQGQEYWKIKVTYGGLILNPPEEIIVSTQQIFILKKAFEKTPWLEIQGKRYNTTRFMYQLGPILHEENQ